MEVYRKANKEHICSECGEVIKKKEIYLYLSFKYPIMDSEDNKQVGIGYEILKLCDKCDDGNYDG